MPAICIPAGDLSRASFEEALALILRFLCWYGQKTAGKRSQTFSQTKASFLLVRVYIIYDFTSLWKDDEWSPSLKTIKIWDYTSSSLTFFIKKKKTTIKMERNFVIIRAPDIILYNTCCYNSILCMMSFYTKMMTMLKIRTMLLVWKCTMLLNYPLKAFRQNHNAEDVCLLFPEEHGIWWLGW